MCTLAKSKSKIGESVMDPRIKKENLYSDVEKAKQADLVLFPKGIKGTNCGNCRYFEDNYCLHLYVNQQVKKEWTCSYWDVEGLIRPWDGENQYQEVLFVSQDQIKTAREPRDPSSWNYMLQPPSSYYQPDAPYDIDDVVKFDLYESGKFFKTLEGKITDDEYVDRKWNFKIKYDFAGDENTDPYQDEVWVPESDINSFVRRGSKMIQIGNFVRVLTAGKRILGIVKMAFVGEIYRIQIPKLGERTFNENEITPVKIKFATEQQQIDYLNQQKMMLETDLKDAEDDYEKSALKDRIEKLDMEINKANTKEATENPHFFDSVDDHRAKVRMGLKKEGDEIEDGNEKKLRSPSSVEVSEKAQDEQDLEYRREGFPGEGVESEVKIAEDVLVGQPPSDAVEKIPAVGNIKKKAIQIGDVVVTLDGEKGTVIDEREDSVGGLPIFDVLLWATNEIEALTEDSLEFSGATEQFMEDEKNQVPTMSQTAQVQVKENWNPDGSVSRDVKFDLVDATEADALMKFLQHPPQEQDDEDIMKEEMQSPGDQSAEMGTAQNADGAENGMQESAPFIAPSMPGQNFASKKTASKKVAGLQEAIREWMQVEEQNPMMYSSGFSQERDQMMHDIAEKNGITFEQLKNSLSGDRTAEVDFDPETGTEEKMAGGPGSGRHKKGDEISVIDPSISTRPGGVKGKVVDTGGGITTVKLRDGQEIVVLDEHIKKHSSKKIAENEQAVAKAKELLSNGYKDNEVIEELAVRFDCSTQEAMDYLQDAKGTTASKKIAEDEFQVGDKVKVKSTERKGRIIRIYDGDRSFDHLVRFEDNNEDLHYDTNELEKLGSKKIAFGPTYDNLYGEEKDLVEICENRLGSAIAEQLESIMTGESMEEQNPNALQRIMDFLKGRNTQEELVGEIEDYLRSNISTAGIKKEDKEVEVSKKQGKAKNLETNNGRESTNDLNDFYSQYEVAGKKSR